jgi:3-hydroxyacyl-[acyl-carrier-protein] dehydratase
MPGESRPVLDNEEIQRILPHRYPFLLIDRILEQSPGRCVALKNVTANEGYFNGHFPGRPIVPGCLLMESLAQAGSFMGPRPGTEKAAKVVEVLLLSAESKFLRPVVPGDQLVITASFLSEARNIVRFKAEGHVEGTLVVAGKFMVMLRREAVR